MAEGRQPVGAGQTGRAAADDGDLLAAVRSGFEQLDVMIENVIDRVPL